MSDSVDFQALLAQATSGQSLHVLNAPNLQQTMTAAFGNHAETVKTTEVFLYAAVIDNTGSMDKNIAGPNGTVYVPDELCVGYNQILEDLKHATVKEGCWVLSSMVTKTGTCPDGILHPWMPLVDAPPLERGKNYHPNGGSTPLYDAVISTAGAALAKKTWFNDQGVDCRCVILIVTDGFDNASRAKAQDCATVLQEMLNNDEGFIVIAVGLGQKSDFEPIFLGMGIRPNWIKTAEPGMIKEVCGLVSKSVSSASKSAGSFSQMSQQGLAGFGV